jgi:GT2 family glycosyltransferase
MQEDVEVLIAHRNNLPKLRRCLEALRAQTLPGAVCVIDDASTDETPLVVPAQYPEVRYLRLADNEGFSRANNHAIRSTQARWVVLLNNDTVPEPDFLERLLAARDASGARAVAACLRRMDGSVDSFGIEVDRSLIASDLGHGCAYETAAARPLEPLAPCAGAGLYETSLLHELGGFDEEMWAYLEDVELGLRMAIAGVRCAAEPDAVAWHDHSASFGSGTAFKNRRMGDSRGYLCWKYGADLTVAERARGWLVDGVVYAGQIVIDRNAGAVRGRLEGRRRRGGAEPPAAHPGFERVPRARTPVRRALARRLGRRR